MKTSTHCLSEHQEVHSPRFWETPPQPVPMPAICIGSAFLGAVLTALLLFSF